MFLKIPTGGKMPVNADSLTEGDIWDLANHVTVYFDFKRHKSHFSDCPGAANFRNRNNELRLL